ncbi:phenylalanine--tRNA ligase subunit beta [Calidifontibacter sp. DB0510]|uniref:Phenylalanine--tRNA ligase beta subunit n=1 Tax=Metallococcus carri TaxID=1656884 RepID=A0A967EBW3_9MICO|nr:phenylalanine--tRNA ligase subunit beta [Metallococcus carri]NHN57394.1 phenylalanine--tRNA ligase subunit beta [Metallococcus carri]NOP39210.1 phenylalanine--tRNA ligase subunit beta [Calidifontibacter sp. DB2511S]
MRVPVDWLREYVEVPTDARGADIAESLVRVGLEEEGLHGGDVTGPLVVGKVLTMEPEQQKNGKTINWCTVDVGDANGTGEPQGIVCGAHNFAPGDLVVVVLPGGVLPGGFEISARKTYGHVSAGMICAADELGFPDDGSGGIIRLAERLGRDDLTPGEDAIPLLGLDRETVEINVTPDRGYCFSIRGVAREYSASTGATFTDPAIALGDKAPRANDAGFEVRIEDAAPLRGQVGCSRYVARIVRGIDPTAPTPAWLAVRLTEAGMRSISLPVDVTNYVMLALGQPLHAFDLATLDGPIVVRRATEGEKLTTLDDVERTLFAEDLLITDQQRILAIAGVMGGENSEVSDATRDVLIESAHFDPVSVARTARRHKLPSEASRRFERGVDPLLAPAAAQLAVDLLVEYGGGTVDEGVTDVGTAYEPVSIALNPKDIGRIVGVEYADDRVREILTQIGCEVSPEFTVTPPSWRPDLTTWPDLAEEVARIDGYDKIPSIVPTPPGGRGLTTSQAARRLVGESLAAQGLFETWADPFIGDDAFEALGFASDDPRRQTVRIANPLSDEKPWFRTTVLPGLLEALRRNVARGSKDVAIFEQGLVVGGPAGTAKTYPVGTYPGPEAVAAIEQAVPAQPRMLGWALTGHADRAGWWGGGRAADWSDAIAVARAAAEALAVELVVTAGDRAPFHPGRCAQLALPDGTVIGHAGELHPKVIGRLGLPARTVAGELDLDALIAAAGSPQARILSNFPVVQSDIALIVPSQTPSADVERVLRSAAGDNLEAIQLFDVYDGDQVGEGRKSLAYRMTFRADRTLKTEEVNGFRDAAVAAAEQEFGATLRA